MEQFVAQEKARLTQVYAQNQLKDLKKECTNWMKWIEKSLSKNDGSGASRDIQKMKDSLDKRREEVELIEEGERYLNEMDEYVAKYSSTVANVSVVTEIGVKEKPLQDAGTKQAKASSTKAQHSSKEEKPDHVDVAPLEFAIEKEGIVPVFDVSKSDKKLYSPLMSINRSTQQIQNVLEEWDEVIKNDNYVRDEELFFSRVKTLHEKISDLLETVLFTAARLQSIQGAGRVYDMIEQRVQNAKNIIDEKLNAGKVGLSFENLLNEALSSIEILDEELENTGKTELFSDYEVKILHHIVPTIQKAMEMIPDRRSECEKLMEKFNQLKQKISEAQIEVGRKKIAEYMEKRNLRKLDRQWNNLKSYVHLRYMLN